jgi:two-component system phosphate regulon response regulator OmpR
VTVAQAATITAATTRTPPQPADDAPHLLLVDDDRRIRDLLSRFLSGEGYRVTTAASATDARAKLLGLHFDLLILDVMMPGETGFDLARFIRTSSSVPIIMLTARHEAEARIEGLQIGADDYVAKPFEPRELVLRIGNILKHRQRARRRRADQPAAPQDRKGSGQSAVPAGGARHRLSPGRVPLR